MTGFQLAIFREYLGQLIFCVQFGYNMSHYIKIQFAIFLIFFTQAKIQKLPIVTNNKVISLRLNQLIDVDSSFLYFGKLQNIYKKQVFQMINDQEHPFSTCYQNPPETHFNATFKKTINDYVPRHGVIYDFQKIKQQRSLIDITSYNQKLYYILGNGQFKIQNIMDKGKQIIQQKTYQTFSKIQKGNIVIMGDTKNGSNKGYGLFVNQNFAFLFNLKTNQISPINNYKTAEAFQSAIYLEKGFLAIAYGRQGMKIFSIDFATLTLTLQAQLTNQNSDMQNFNIQDLTYDSNRKILFILDINAGVITMQLILAEDQVFTKQARTQIKHSQCNLIYYDGYSQDLYVNCRQLHKYHINNWPIADQKVLLPQDIFVQEITYVKNVVALVSRQAFQIIYSSRKTSIYKSNLLDKLILTQKYFISANQYEIIIGNYSSIPPTISCTTNDKTIVGNHHLVLKVTAGCNQQYLNRINYPLDKIVRGDKCVYTICQNLEIWAPATLNNSLFVAILIVIVILGILIVVWWARQLINFKKIQSRLSTQQDLPSQIMKEVFQGQQVAGSSQASLDSSQISKQSPQRQEKKTPQ